MGKASSAKSCNNAYAYIYRLRKTFPRLRTFPISVNSHEDICGASIKLDPLRSGATLRANPRQPPSAKKGKFKKKTS